MDSPDKHQLKTQEHGGVTWADVQDPSHHTLTELAHKFNLQPIHLNESLQKVQHNQVEREENYLFLVMHYPVQLSQSGKLTFGQIGLFLGEDFVVTIRNSTCPAVTRLFEERQTAAADAQSAGFLLYAIIDRILSDISELTDKAVAELDEIEDLVFDNNTSDAQRIGLARQKIVRLIRIIGPKRAILQDLTEQIDSFTGDGLSDYFSGMTKTVNKLWEEIEEAKETVEIYKDADYTTSTEQTNEILAVLTIIFTFTIPITVVGTLYGMNVPLPGGLASGAWTFLGTYTTFIMLLVFSGLVALAMFLYFRNKKWL